jgi:hypothetical protein
MSESSGNTDWAFEQLLQGNKVRLAEWDSTDYLYRDSSNYTVIGSRIMDLGDRIEYTRCSMGAFKEKHLGLDWELYTGE